MDRSVCMFCMCAYAYEWDKKCKCGCHNNERKSMTTNYGRVKEFHEAMEQPVGKGISKDPESLGLLQFRMSLINEEVQEVFGAANQLLSTVIKGNNIPAYKEAKAHLLKEIQDLKYVLEGFCVTYGWDSEEAADRVHKSNMTKFDIDPQTLKRVVTKDANGKVMKSPNYEPPVLDDLVNDDAEDYSRFTEEKEDDNGKQEAPSEDVQGLPDDNGSSGDAGGGTAGSSNAS